MTRRRRGRVIPALIACFYAGVAVGWWVDDKLGSSPVATLTFGLGAMVTAIWRLIVLSRREAIERRENDARSFDRIGEKDSGET